MAGKKNNLLYGTRPGLSEAAVRLRKAEQALEDDNLAAVISYLKSETIDEQYYSRVEPLIVAVVEEEVNWWPRLDGPLPDNNFIFDLRRTINSPREELDGDIGEVIEALPTLDKENFTAALTDALLASDRPTAALTKAFAGVNLALMLRLFFRTDPDGYLHDLLGDNLVWLLLGLAETRGRQAAEATKIVLSGNPQIYEDRFGPDEKEMLHIVNWPRSSEAICDHQVFLETMAKRGAWRDQEKTRCLDCFDLANNSPVILSQEGLPDKIPFGQDDEDCYTLLETKDYEKALADMRKRLDAISAGLADARNEAAATEAAFAEVSRAVEEIGLAYLSRQQERLADIFFSQWYPSDGSIDYRMAFIDQLVAHDDPGRIHLIHDSKNLEFKQVTKWLSWVSKPGVPVDDGAARFRDSLDKWIIKLAKKRGVKAERRNRRPGA